MPKDKDLKRLVRTRMKKTGESYTTARAHLVGSNHKAASTPGASTPVPFTAHVVPAEEPSRNAAPPVAPTAADYAELAGMSDETIREKTGRGWVEWVQIIDERGGREMTHGERASLINEEYGVDGWWSQSVTTGYERIRGMRARGQRMDGSWEVSKSQTYAVPVAELFEAWSDAKLRRRWLNEAGVKLRTAQAPRSLRLGFPDGTIVAVGFTPKGDLKSSVAVQHTKLKDKQSAERMKRFWAERLSALAEVLK
jgi:uncharacterized protein YndB with AHSA1/START domain